MSSRDYIQSQRCGT